MTKTKSKATTKKATTAKTTRSKNTKSKEVTRKREPVVDVEKPTIKVPALKRILRRIGVARIDMDIYEYMRKDIENFITLVTKNTLVFTDVSNRKTLKEKDLYSALNHLGIDLMVASNPNSKKTSYLQSCTSKGVSMPKASTSTRKVKLNVKSKRAIKFYQKNSDCLAIPKTNFKRLVKATILHLRDDVEYHAGDAVLSLFQHVVEQYMMRKYNAAYHIAIHANRKTIMKRDAELVTNILRYGVIQAISI